MLTRLCWLFYVLHTSLTHLSQMEFPTLMNWTSPFPFFGLLGGIFHYYSNFNRMFRIICKQIVENLIRHRILWCLIWFHTVCLCLTKRTLGLHGLTLIQLPCWIPVFTCIINQIGNRIYPGVKIWMDSISGLWDVTSSPYSYLWCSGWR